MTEDNAGRVARDNHKELNTFLKDLHLHIKDASDAGYICSLIRQKVDMDTADSEKRVAGDMLEMLDALWSFNNRQEHTHTWHDKQTFLEQYREKYGLEEGK